MLFMINSLKLITLTVTAFMLVGCGSTTHTIRTKDSREYHSVEKPDITDDRYVKFETTSGQQLLIKQDEISTISEG
jgi:uncharacterized protein YcfL